MPNANFHLFSTAGNTTLFVDRPDAVRPAMRMIPCEQAGYADLAAGIVHMAADEFCVNACLAFAALRRLAGLAAEQLRMLNIPVLLQANGECPNWQASATLPFGQCALEEVQNIKIARLPGISHALIGVDELPPASAARKAGANYLAALGLCQEPAAGIVWHAHKNGARHAILPLVSVPGVGTCNFEQACGSATIALALFLGEGDHQVEQPSGEIATVRHLGRSMEIAQPVQLLAQGELWLP